jgi:hypothetical protein
MAEKENKKLSEIAAELDLPYNTVRENYHRLVKQGPRPNFYLSASKPGRPRRFNSHDKRQMARLILSGTARDGSDMQRMLFPDAPARTVHAALQSIGLNGRVHRSKPLLTKIHVKKRKYWAEQVQHWDAGDWNSVWFSDEAKFNLFGSDGKRYCRRRAGEEFLDRNVKKTVKHGGGSLMVWGCIGPDGPGRLHRVQGTMDAKQYVQILKESLLTSLQDHKVDPSEIYFQQDNDPKHTSALAQAFFEEHGIDLLPWAPSADMNPIEHVWD